MKKNKSQDLKKINYDAKGYVSNLRNQRIYAIISIPLLLTVGVVLIVLNSDNSFNTWFWTGIGFIIIALTAPFVYLKYKSDHNKAINRYLDKTKK